MSVILRGRYVFTIIIMGILVLLVLGFNNRVAELRRLSEEAARLEDESRAIQLTKIVLATQVVEAASAPLVEEWAYQDARMLRDAEGDHLIIPLVDPNATPVSLEPIEVQIQTVENWEVWLALFFDEDAP